MKIERFCYGPEGTFSRATLGGKTFYFCEPPWQNNTPFVSCIPEGEYSVKPDMTGEYRGFELQNVPGRSQIEIHTGNTADDTQGCLMPGFGLGYVKGRWAVVNSTAAMRELKQLMRQEKVKKITITSVFAAKKAKKKKEAKND